MKKFSEIITEMIDNSINKDKALQLITEMNNYYEEMFKNTMDKVIK